ncbi:MAG: beta-ketoacyl-ACP synthase II, partial [Planctomycetaceae bacterium]|nr:beta-ketoacyl-ACP synthase II [Planctomycetaceae bacterium]
SGLDFTKEDRSRCASIIGSGVGGLAEIEVQHQKLIDKGPSRVSPFTIPKIMPNAAAGQVSIQYQLTGPSYAVSTACASGANAIRDAIGLIRRGAVDVVITGGTEAALTKLGMSGFCAMRALSERNDDPQRASRPFDKDRDGFVISEGAGILVLESEEHARARGAAILGEILGAGVTSDGTHITQPDEQGLEAARAMTLALNDARVDAAKIDYINAHGTSTTLGDLAETAAIKLAFGDLAKKIPISSTKSQMGHLLGGSAGVAAILTLLTLRDGVIPPTINLENPDPACDLDYTPLVAREKKCSIAITNSFGFGGHNACLVIGR